MSTVIFQNNRLHTDISVPAPFLSDYMPFANGEYVKVYLYLLQCLQSGRNVDTEEMADLFEITQKDIRRALTYWETEGLLKLTYTKRDLTGLKLLEPWYEANDARMSNGASPKSAVISHLSEHIDSPVADNQAKSTQTAAKSFAVKDASAMELFALTPRQRQEAENSPDFQMFLGLVQSYQIKPILSQIDCEKLMMLFFQLDRNFGILELLTEYCAENGKRSLNYLEKLAMECQRQGLVSEKDVKLYLARKKNGLVVMKAFGQANREAGEAEYSFIDRWFNLYGFRAELVKEACNRALLTTHEPNFQYAEGILKKWYEENIRTLEQVEQNDSAHRAKAKLGKVMQRNSYTGNRFNNFEQNRSNDEYDVLTDVLENLAPAGSKK